MIKLLCAMALIAGIISCARCPGSDNPRLIAVDSLIAANEVDIAFDSLRAIDNTRFNRHDMAYYHLLSIITQERLHKNFSNDSLATAVTDYFSRFRESENYLRSLLYQAIARMRLGSPDSMVYAPLKLAQELVTSQPGYYTPGSNALVKYYLGVINDEHRNYELAANFFTRSKELAMEAGNSELQIKAAINLFWNHLRYNRLDSAQAILNEIGGIDQKTYEALYGFRNAEAALFLVKDELDSAIHVYRRLTRESKETNRTVWIPNIYFALSRAFESMGEGDSALVYARLAVANIVDTSFQRRNYLLHKHLGEVAKTRGDYQLAAGSFYNAYSDLLNSVNEISDRRILELEKQFNYSRVQMEAIKREQRDQLIIITIFGIALFLAMLIVIYRLKLRANRGQLEMETLLRQKAEVVAIINKKEAMQKESQVKLYHHLTRHHVRTGERLEQLSYKFLKKNPEIHDEIQSGLTELKSEFINMLPELVNDDLFYSHIKITPDIPLTNIEKVILFLLYCRTPTYQIAALLAINPGNLRVKKLNLKRKLSGYTSEIKNMEEIMAIF